jgi:hypothetical protein
MTVPARGVVGVFPMYLTFVTLVLAVAIGAIIVEIKNGQPSVLSTVKF